LSRRYLIIPDTQVKPGVDTSHLTWLGHYILDKEPDVIVHLGDHWDLPSLSTHDAPGSSEAEGRRVMPDIEVGNAAWLQFWAPVERRIKRLIQGHRKRWAPECHFLFGNHEDRLTRAVSREPKWQGLLSLDLLKTPGFIRHPYLQIITLDGIKFCHYFANPHSGKAIGGTINNRLAKIGSSFVQGHQQGFLYSAVQRPDHVAHGLSVGSFYLHNESYRPADVQNSEWRGVVLLNEVKNGDFCINVVSMDFLRKRYA
jgi:hypothetical protein